MNAPGCRLIRKKLARFCAHTTSLVSTAPTAYWPLAVVRENPCEDPMRKYRIDHPKAETLVIGGNRQTGYPLSTEAGGIR